VLHALPYCWTLLFVPMHFMTFELLLLATGVWTTNIHDTVDGKARADCRPAEDGQNCSAALQPNSGLALLPAELQKSS